MIGKKTIPTLVTAFDETGNIDYNSVSRHIDKLIADGTDGLFAVCQSSEMFNLSIEEKVDLAAFVKNESRINVIASGHTQKSIQKQIEAMKKIASTGVDAVVLITNAFADALQNDDVFLKNLDIFLRGFNENIPLGIYECPYPYKRLLTKKTLKYILDTDRFIFLKDTSCDVEVMKERISLIKNSKFGLFNANAETLAETSLLNIAGFSGIVANVSVKLMRCLMEYPLTKSGIGKKAQLLVEEFSKYLKSAYYPISAKIVLKEMGIYKTIETRVASKNLITNSMIKKGKVFLERIRKFENEYDNLIKE